MGIEDIGFHVFQDLDETACGNVLAHKPARQPGKTTPGKCCVRDRCEVIEPQPRVWQDLSPWIIRRGEDPALFIVASSVNDALMLRNIGDRLRYAVPFEIGGRCTDGHPLVSDGAGHQVGMVFQLPVADDKVETILQKVDDTIVEREIEFEFGMLIEQIFQDWCDTEATEEHRHRDTQPATHAVPA